MDTRFLPKWRTWSSHSAPSERSELQARLNGKRMQRPQGVRGSFSRYYRGVPGLTSLHTKIIHCKVLLAIIPSLTREKRFTVCFIGPVLSV